MLSPIEAAAHDRGQALKRYVRAAAALNDIYGDTAIGAAAGVGRGAVAGWWTGSQMKPDHIRLLADATGLSRDELTAFVHYGGPLPTLPVPGLSPVLEGAREAQALLDDEAPGTPSSQPERRPRGTEAGRG